MANNVLKNKTKIFFFRFSKKKIKKINSLVHKSYSDIKTFLETITTLLSMTTSRENCPYRLFPILSIKKITTGIYFFELEKKQVNKLYHHKIYTT